MEDTPGNNVPHQVIQARPMPRHLSFKNVNRRAKRKKLNVYNPTTLNVHETYSFVSKQQGFTAHGSRITIQPASGSSVLTRDSLIAQLDYDIPDCAGTDDYMPEADLEGQSKRKRTASVSRQFHTMLQLFQCLYIGSSSFIMAT
jgi:hypothetical protein